MPAGRFLQAGGTEGCAADLARSTAEGVGGFLKLSRGELHEVFMYQPGAHV